MTGELGQLALCLALALSVVQAFSGLFGATRGDVRVMAMGRGAALGSFVFIALAFFTLMFAYVTSDFSVMAVAENSHTAKPLIYKITGVWGNHEGSMVLWMLILGIYSAAIAMSQPEGSDANARLGSRALGVQALIAIAFLVFILLTSDPFLRLYPQPFEGNGLNPLLQDPGLAFHPPLLYLGYVGLSASFSFAAAALLDSRNDAAWVRRARPFAIAAWTALTLGIAGGSWWAYYTLGWGGFWFWDPVENASLMPWLIATALIHSMMASERTGAFKSWTLLLAIAGFSFSLIGTFLVRSGVLNSVHAFANDPRRGLFILMILFVAITSPLVLFAWRAPKLPPGAAFDIVSRETGILLNNLLLTAAAATILIGTLYPLVLDAAEGIKISVGPPYFTATVIPMMALLAVAMPFGPIFLWRRSHFKPAVWSLRFAIAAGVVALCVALAVARPMSLLGMCAVGLGIWLIAGSATDIARRAGDWRRVRLLPATAFTSALAHAGLGVVALGVAGTSVWKSEAIQVVAPHQTMQIGGYTLRLENTERAQGPNYLADRAEFTVFSGGQKIAVLHPEKRSYPVEQTATSESSIRTTGVSDLYVVLGDPQQGGGWVVRAYYNPMAPFIWLGGVIMALAGFTALGARLGAALRSRRQSPNLVSEPAE
ncbi:MAG: heme lyase CcmF/NrfE family subunit [Alphaproteobacteria bacterium]|nr:heme lyase CcmF/NrfE family subunit [Alphaproteobacteria bacterium]